MPNYDYSCTQCGNFIEEFHKIDDREKITCKECEQCKAADSFKLFVGKEATPIMPLTSIDGRVRPRADFQERMKQMRQGLKYDKQSKLKDHY